MRGTGAVLALDEQAVRTFASIVACAIDLARRFYRCSMQYEVVCNFTECAILLSECTTTTLKMTLH